jgi:hypothetical protein
MYRSKKKYTEEGFLCDENSISSEAYLSINFKKGGYY